MSLKQPLRTTILGSLSAVALTIVTAPISYGFNKTIEDGARSARGRDQVADLFGATGVLTTITNVLLFIIGALAVIMIIIGGLRYVISAGNSTQVTAAKNTILYAVVGLIVAILGFAVVNFVLGAFSSGGSGGTTL